MRGGPEAGVREFRVLGPLQVRSAGRALALGGPKERALLALLLIHPNRVLSVDRLTEELWGDGAPERATAALRVYVSHLRRALGEQGEEVIATRPPGYLLRLAPGQLDATLFETMAAEGHAHLREGRAELAAVRLRDALALWRGPALADVADLGFARAEIGRLEELRLGAVEGRVEADLACGRHAELVAELSALVGEQPLRERLWASRILALYRSGRQAEALAAYQEVRRILAEEVGLDPGPQLAALERAVLAHDPGLEWAAAPANGHPVVVTAEEAEEPAPRLPLPGAMAGIVASTFVGRSEELSHLEAAFDRARGGERQVVLVAGEPGMGKTALAVRAACGLWSKGAVVLFGRCDEESLVPFQPFVEALAHHVERTPAGRLRRLLGEQAADLALLVPELRRTLPELGEAVARGADTERYRLFEAVPFLLRALGAETPVVLVLDDLHWADRPTLQLLQHLIRRAVDVPLLVLGTYRDTDLVRTHPMAQTLAELRRANLVDRVLLRGLVEEDVVALVSPGVEAGAAQRALAAALWRQTEGSPLFLRETLRHLSETGVVRREDGGGWAPRRRIEQLGIPEGVKEVIGRRLTRLSAVTNLALRTGSVMGRSFRLDVLEAVTAEAPEGLLDALEEAIAAGIVTEVAGAPGRYAFTHALVRDALYDELSLTRRVRLHHRVAEALEELTASDPGPHLAELAYHFGQAAVAAGPERAIDYARRAGERAFAQCAYEETARHFAMALEVAEDAGSEPALRADLLLAMGRAQWRAGDMRGARAGFERVVSLVGASDAQRLARAAIGYAGAGNPQLLVDAGRVNTRTIELLEAALSALPARDSTLLARLLASLAQTIYFVPGSAIRRHRLSADAVAMARRTGDARTLVRVLSARSQAVWSPETMDEFRSNGEEIVTIAHAIGDAEFELVGLGCRVLATIFQNDTTEWRRALDVCGRLAEQLKDPISRQYVVTSWAGQAVLEGRFAEGEALLRRAFHEGQEVGDANAFMLFGISIWVLRWLQGRMSEVLHIPATAYTAMPYFLAPMHAFSAAGYAIVGMETEARRELELLDPRDESAIPHDVGWLMTMTMLGIASARVGDAERSAIVHRMLLPHAGVIAVIGGSPGFGPVARVLGITAAAAGLFEEAERHLEDARAICARNGWRAMGAQVALDHAGMLVARGRPQDRDAARELAGEAATVARELGMRLVARGAERILSPSRGGVAEGAERSGRRVVTGRDRLRARVTARGRSAVARLTRHQTDESLTRAFGSRLAQRALFTAMTRAFQPAMALGFEGAICFEVRPADDDGDPAASDWWTVEVRGPSASVRPGGCESATLTMRMRVPDLVRLISGELDPVQALFDHSLTVDGDILAASRLAEMFGAVEPVDLPADVLDSDAPELAR
jgi:DNA-binding SARP family transcriptional activator